MTAKDQNPKDRNRTKKTPSSTETGRVAGQLGGLYSEDPAKRAGKKDTAKKNKTPAKPPEHG